LEIGGRGGPQPFLEDKFIDRESHKIDITTIAPSKIFPYYYPSSVSAYFQKAILAT
jgi:hypothetical protein